ncbi:MAG: hypothetical protein GX075_09270 [Firmicutes bacterium]|nr:hypothetical protein [Bacillota bacterium]
MDRVQVINHQGKEIVYIDFSNIMVTEIETLRKVIEAAKEIIKKYPPASALTLVNFDNLRFSAQFISELKEFTLHNKPYVKMGAAFGVHQGVRKVVFDAVMKFTGRNLHVCDSKEEGLDWLVSNCS